MHRWIKLAGVAMMVWGPSTSAQDITLPSMPGVKINVADMERTTKFYTALGMTIGTRYNAQESSLEWNTPSQGSRIIMVHGGTGWLSFPSGGAFLMISVPDMTATLGRLKVAGFGPFGQPRVNQKFSLLMIKDPDGNTVELLSAGSTAAAGDLHAGH